MKLITLENGLRVFTNKREDLRSATIGIWVASGSRFESKTNNGISHFMEHIVFKGSKTRSALEIAKGMDKIGATLNAYTTKEYTFFYTRALDYHILEAADILFDMIKNPKLDEKDIETERGVILEEIAMCEDDPGDVCYEKNEAAIFKDNPLSFEILGTRETVSALKKEDFLERIEKFYVPERMVIGIGGNFDEEALLEKVNAYFAKDKNTLHPLTEAEVPFHKTITTAKKNFEQTHMMLSFKGLGLGHKELPALQVCSFILGAESSSRLNQRIREQLGLVYGIESWLGRYLGGGYVAVSMSLSSDNQEIALKETCKIIREFSETLTDEELDAAKEKLISGLIMSREQPHSKLIAYGANLLLLSKFVEDDELIDSVKNVTLDQIKQAANQYLRLEEASFTAVGKVKSKEFYQKIISGKFDS